MAPETTPVTKVLVAFCTCPALIAESFAQSMINYRVAACVNILPGVQSIYRWNDEIQSEQETLLIIKSTAAQWDALKSFVNKNHPYDLPELIAMPVEAGLQGYMEWITRTTTSQQPV